MFERHIEDCFASLAAGMWHFHKISMYAVEMCHLCCSAASVFFFKGIFLLEKFGSD